VAKKGLNMRARFFLLLAGALLTLLPLSVKAQTAKPAVDVTGAQMQSFIDNEPKDRISDLPIRVADVGNAKVGVYGVFRPKAQHGDAIRHDTSVTEVYYVLEGSGRTMLASFLDRSAPLLCRIGPATPDGPVNSIREGPKNENYWPPLEPLLGLIADSLVLPHALSPMGAPKQLKALAVQKAPC
jgi:hypothetical protein